jgi:hypothetical protein
VSQLVEESLGAPAAAAATTGADASA